MSQRLHLHVGLPKSGSTFVQGLLAEHRPALREAGRIYPFLRPEGMFHAAVEIRQEYDVWGIDRAVADGSWAALVARVRESGADGMISHELLGAATPEQITRAADALGGLELHLVVTARDPSRAAAAHWQEQVKNGRTDSFAAFEAEVRASGPLGADSRALFWQEQDLADVLDRWGALVPPERLHVVVCPPPGSPRMELWHRFAGAVDLDPAVVAEPAAGANPSLGAAQVALLRRVVDALDGRLVQPHYAHVVKRYFAQRLLARVSSAPPVTPPELHRALTGVARGWVERISRSGHPVYGDLAELVPGDPESAPYPDDVPAEAVLDGAPEAIADLLVEVSELREQVRRLEQERETPRRTGLFRRR